MSLAISTPALTAQYNSPGVLGLKKREDGSYYLIAPESETHKLPVVFTRGDFGLWVQAAIEQRSETGVKTLAATEALSHEDIAERIGAVIGKKVRAGLSRSC